MEGRFRLRSLMVRDHRDLADRGLLPRPYRIAREAVSGWLGLKPASLCFAIEEDEIFRGAVCCFVEPRAPFSGRMEFYLEPETMEALPEWIGQVTEVAFGSGNLHRIELLLPPYVSFSPERLEEAGFQPDGKLRDVLPLNKAWQDVVLYSALRHEQGEDHYAFLPTQASVISVYGNEEEVMTIDFLQYGHKVGVSKLFDSAFAAGIIDASGTVLRQKTRCTIPDPLPAAVSEAAEQIEEYLRGSRRVFDLPMAKPQGTEFQRAVWSVLESIPYGETRSYMEVAIELVNRRSPHLQEKERRRQAHNLSRAVGMACGANTQCLTIPCHRVVGQDRKLTGFTGGVETKAFLLDLELLNAGGESSVSAGEVYQSGGTGKRKRSR